MSPYVQTVQTPSGATAVEIVYSSRRGSREIEHLWSAHRGAEAELLKNADVTITVPIMNGGQ